MSDRVVYTVEDGVADVRLNRPDKINALDPAMFEAIVDVGEALKADRSVRAVVLSGEGRGFCAGLDFGSFTAMAEAGSGSGGDGGSRERDRPVADLGGRPEGRIANRGQQTAWVWQELEVPV